jgi:hypothetical protein
MPLPFKLILKLDGARPMSKIFSCFRPIITAPDIAFVLERQTPPGGSFLIVPGE